MHLQVKLFAIGLGCCCFAVAAQQTQQVQISPELRAEMKNVAVHSQVIMVTGYKGKAKAFHADSDTSTLQIVQLVNKSDGSSHVSANGEVIFMQPGTSDQQMQTLFTTAFYRKAKLQLSKKPHMHPSPVPATTALVPSNAGSSEHG